MNVIGVLLSARWLSAALLALALLLIPVQSSGGQILASARSGSRQAQAQLVPKAFMPLVAAPPEVEIQFGTGVDAQNNLINPGTTFGYGIAQLYYRYTVVAAPDRLYRTEWFVDGVRQPQLDDSGLIPSTPAVLTNFFCSPTLGSCDQPVPRAVYQVKFYIEDVLYRQAIAVVQ